MLEFIHDLLKLEGASYEVLVGNHPNEMDIKCNFPFKNIKDPEALTQAEHLLGGISTVNILYED